MPEGSGGNEGATLVAALKEARADPEAPVARAIAILWSWLDRHLLTLGSLQEKPPMIRSVAVNKASFSGEVTDKILADIASEPLREAAMLLACIELYYVGLKKGLLATQVPDIDGRDVIVCWRDPALVLMASEWLPDKRGDGTGDDERKGDPFDTPRPPTSNEHPSLSTLAPRLSVSPVRDRGIELKLLATDNKQWRSTRDRMQSALCGSEPKLCIHLDTLGEHGLTGFYSDEEGPIDCRTARFDPATIKGYDEDALIAAARKAVNKASGTGNVLLMPELCATPKVHAAVVAELRERTRRREEEEESKGKGKSKTRDAPAMTVMGLFHAPPSESPVLDPSLVKDVPTAGYVNEAVVLAADGSELWRHRKMSSAQGDVDHDRDDSHAKSYIEDIVLGTTLAIAPTPMGMVSVLICLDSFAPHVRDRVARSPAEILLVPSLSPEAKRHRTSLGQLVQGLWGAAFVCNRAYEAAGGRSVWDEPETRSFWVMQRSDVAVFRRKYDEGAHPSFVFRLAREIRKRVDKIKREQEDRKR